MPPAAVACPLCGSADLRRVYDLSRADFADAVPGVVYRCRACPMWFKALAHPEALPTAYPGEFGDDPVSATYLLGDAARAVFRDALAGLRPLPATPPPRLLDIGAGQGALLEEAARLGFAGQGIEHCEDNVARARARGLDVRLARAEDLELHEAVDVVTMMDFIEHVPDPLRILAAAHRALRPGGELVVYTPNHRGAVVLLARLLHALGVRHPAEEFFGRNHVAFFDDRSLPWALRAAGFELLELRQIAYDPSRPGQEVSRLALAATAAIEQLGRPFGRLFRLLAYARKA